MGAINVIAIAVCVIAACAVIGLFRGPRLP